MKRGPGMRRIEKGDEEGYGGVAMNVCLGIQFIISIYSFREKCLRHLCHPTFLNFPHGIAIVDLLSIPGIHKVSTTTCNET